MEIDSSYRLAPLKLPLPEWVAKILEEQAESMLRFFEITFDDDERVNMKYEKSVDFKKHSKVTPGTKYEFNIDTSKYELKQYILNYQDKYLDFPILAIGFNSNFSQEFQKNDGYKLSTNFADALKDAQQFQYENTDYKVLLILRINPNSLKSIDHTNWFTCKKNDDSVIPIMFVVCHETLMEGSNIIGSIIPVEDLNQQVNGMSFPKSLLIFTQDGKQSAQQSHQNGVFDENMANKFYQDKKLLESMQLQFRQYISSKKLPEVDKTKLDLELSKYSINAKLPLYLVIQLTRLSLQKQGIFMYSDKEMTKEFSDSNIWTLQGIFGTEETLGLRLEFSGQGGFSYAELKDLRKSQQLIQQLRLSIETFIPNFKQEELIIHTIDNCPLNICFSFPGMMNYDLQKFRKHLIEDKYFPKIGITNLYFGSIFRFCNLTESDFSPRYDFIYDHAGNVDKRGYNPVTKQKFSYYLPGKGAIGYALNVSQKYDNKNDNWILHNEENKDEWVLLFYGARDLKGNQKISGLNGDISSFKNQKCKLFPDKSIGVGALFSQKIQHEVDNAVKIRVGNVNYSVIFQCRVRPNALRQISEHEYLVNDVQNVRVYRIIIQSEEAK